TKLQCFSLLNSTQKCSIVTYGPDMANSIGRRCCYAPNAYEQSDWSDYGRLPWHKK
uniref:Uncharacterized protein n=1 Tax=Amphimedon queenslandica TaxID=400682 RepID=A0A1X7VAI8_AMPQE